MFARPGKAAMVALLGASMATAAPGDDPSVDIRLDTDEAEAVLAILVAQDAGEPVEPAHWDRVLASEGYSRLKDREAAMRRPPSTNTTSWVVLRPRRRRWRVTL